MHVVAVFNDQESADDAAQALTRSDLAPGDVRFVNKGDLESDSFLENFAEVFSAGENEVDTTLRREGMKPSAAEFYAERVKHEGVLIIVEADKANADELRSLLQKAGGQQVNAF
jgi:hypothetical protein